MNFPPELLETLSHLIEGGDTTYAALRLQLDLEGYDIADAELVAGAVRQARQVLRDRRFVNGAFGRLTAVMLNNAEIGRRLDIPKSTVQALASGRIPERLTGAQRDAFKALIVEIVDGCSAALDALG